MKRIWIYLLAFLFGLVACERPDPQGRQSRDAVEQTVAVAPTSAPVVEAPTSPPVAEATATEIPTAAPDPTPQEMWYLPSWVKDQDCRYAVYGHPGRDDVYECTLLVGTQFSMGVRNEYGQLDPIWSQQEEAVIELGENSQFGECKEETLEGGIVKGLVLVTDSKYFWVHLMYPCRGPSN